MAATRKDRGNSWASRAPLNDDHDRAPIVANLRQAASWSKQLFQAEPAAGGQVVVLSFADWWTHSIRRQTADLREHLASNVGTDRQKIFSWSGKAAFGVLFFVILCSQLTSLRQNILERRFARCTSGLISYKKRLTKRVTFAA